jgi:glycosyltransferase involved in cell wall biosynthesis
MNGVVAVITRTKDRPLLLRRAIQSVLDQSFRDWQHVIVNDGGEPAAIERLVAEFSDRYAGRCRVIHIETSRGMEAASNHGIRESQSHYIAIHDDDDSWEPEFLRKTVAYLEQPKLHPLVAGVVTHTRKIVETISGDQVLTVQSVVYGTDFDAIHLFRILAANMFPPIAFLFRREALETVGPFREDLPVLGDWEFNVRFLQKFEIGVLAERLARYHHRQPSIDVAYRNTVVSKVDIHRHYTALLRNSWLREDVQSGKFGIGSLANLSWRLHQIEWAAQSRWRHKSRQSVMYVSSWIGRLPGRVFRFAARTRKSTADGQ